MKQGIKQFFENCQKSFNRVLFQIILQRQYFFKNTIQFEEILQFHQFILPYINLEEFVL